MGAGAGAGATSLDLQALRARLAAATARRSRVVDFMDECGWDEVEMRPA